MVQIANALSGTRPGWKSHPAVRMWEGHTFSLLDYGEAMCIEWISRGYRDSCRARIAEIRCSVDPDSEHVVAILAEGSYGEGKGLPALGPAPWWLGNAAFHFAHRCNLVRKHPSHYGALFPDVLPEHINTPYLWPGGPRG